MNTMHRLFFLLLLFVLNIAYAQKDSIIDGQIERVVLAHQDRLARFGYKLLVHLCRTHQCELLVMNTEEQLRRAYAELRDGTFIKQR